MKIERLSISPGHNYFGHHGQPPGSHATLDIPEVECVAGRGLRGDRFFDYRPDYSGQVTFFAAEVLTELASAFQRADVALSDLRRNVLTQGVDLAKLIGTTFIVQDITFEGIEECRPCYWMNQTVAPGAEAWLRGKGGLRCRIVSSGWLRREP